MEPYRILKGKNSLVEFLKSKGFKEEKDYYDPEYDKASYFKFGRRRLLAVYEVLDREKIRDIRNHSLIEKGLSYCAIHHDGKVLFFRNFGEGRYFLYSERTMYNKSKTDKLSRISENFDIIFQRRDISGAFYEKFKLKRNFLVRHIKNKIRPVKKYLLAQKIFDRIFFVYFLCHKEIVRTKDGGIISGGNLFRIMIENGIFIENLNNLFHFFNSTDNHFLKVGKYAIRIPYLNGGLFRPDPLEPDLKFNLKNKDWKSIFDFLNQYHWIIEENVEAAVEDEEMVLTPEILGHVYERSVVEWERVGFDKEAEKAAKQVSERKNKGVYYTPEQVTSYITRNAIHSFILDQFGKKYGNIDDLVEHGSRKELKETLNQLSQLKVLDPACGSGAFLIKASEVLFHLKVRIMKKLGQKSIYYNTKLETITENIFGVDILEGAIEIAKLRLWLWLISDYTERPQIQSLPNIEYNLKVGNSLFGWQDEKLIQMPLETPLTDEVRGFFSRLIAYSSTKERKIYEKAKRLLATHTVNDYIEAYSSLRDVYKTIYGLKSTLLKDVLEKIRDTIYYSVNPSFLNYVNEMIDPDYAKKKHSKMPISLDHYKALIPFHWRVDFGNVIAGNGFDVIIGNPPYVFTRGKHFSKEEKRYFNKFLEKQNIVQAKSGRNIQSGKLNLYTLFLVKTINLSRENVRIGLIIPNNILRATTYDIIRRYVLDSCNIVEIVDLSSGVFKGVTASTIVLALKKSHKKIKRIENRVKIVSDVENLLVDSFGVHEIRQGNFYNNISFAFNIYVDEEKGRIMRKIEENTIPLGSICRYIIEGIVGSKRKDVFNKKMNAKFKKFLVGKDIHQYCIDYKGKFIRYDRARLHRARPEEVFDCKEKIILQRIGGGYNPIVATIDRDRFYTFASVNNILLRKNAGFLIEYILALMNSKLINWYYLLNFTNKSALTVNISKTFLEHIPVKRLPKEKQESFKVMVNEVLRLRAHAQKTRDSQTKEEINSKAKEIEQEIDHKVFKLYGLNEKEIRIVAE